MALPTSGQLALSQISDEFGGGSRTNVSLRTLSAAAGLSIPDGFNEFYGLANYAVPTYAGGASSISGGGTSSNPYVVFLNSSRFYSFDSEFYSDNSPYNPYEIHMIDKVSQLTGGIYSGTNPGFTIQASGNQRMYIKPTSIGINLNAGCPHYWSYFVHGTSQFYFQKDYYNTGSQTGAQLATNNTYSEVRNWNQGTYVGIFIQSSQNAIEEYDYDKDGFFEESYENCNFTLSHTSVTLQVWFEKA